MTEPAASADVPPHHKYTLRGVCTEPHVTYVLRPNQNLVPDDADPDSSTPEWQWWRVSFSTEDAKARHAKSGKPDSTVPKDCDVIGYTARKVREIEVLRAAREESKTVLLIYANENALKVPEEPAPAQLLVRSISSRCT